MVRFGSLPSVDGTVVNDPKLCSAELSPGISPLSRLMEAELLLTSDRPSGDIDVVLISPHTPDAGPLSRFPDSYPNPLSTHSYWVVFDLPVALNSQEEAFSAVARFGVHSAILMFEYHRLAGSSHLGLLPLHWNCRNLVLGPGGLVSSLGWSEKRVPRAPQRWSARSNGNFHLAISRAELRALEDVPLPWEGVPIPTITTSSRMGTTFWA